MAATVRAERGVDYGLGKLIDIYRPQRPAGIPVVLLWHGVGPDERDVLETLARATAELGVMVCVPDWRPDAPDNGRRHLLASIGFTRERAAGLGGDPARIVLAGWSRGGRAAAGVALNPSVTAGWQPSAVVCLGSSFSTPAPVTGTPPASDLIAGGVSPVPFWLVHGTKDPVVDAQQSRDFAAALESRGWPVHLDEIPADHAGVIMAEYDPGPGRCRPATADHTIATGRRAAHVLSLAATGRDGISNP
jgi:acetyl esterase/lipase